MRVTTIYEKWLLKKYAKEYRREALWLRGYQPTPPIYLKWWEDSILAPIGKFIRWIRSYTIVKKDYRHWQFYHPWCKMHGVKMCRESRIAFRKWWSTLNNRIANTEKLLDEMIKLIDSLKIEKTALERQNFELKMKYNIYAQKILKVADLMIIGDEIK